MSRRRPRPPRREELPPTRAGDTAAYDVVSPVPDQPGARRVPGVPVRPFTGSGRAGDTEPFNVVGPFDFTGTAEHAAVPAPPLPLGPQPATLDTATKGIAFAAVILMLGNILSRVLGLAREQTASYLFGAGDEMAAFIIADNIHTMLFDLVISGMMMAALIPVLSEYVAERQRDELRRITGALLMLAVLAVGGVVLLMEVFAPAAVRAMTALGGGEAERGTATFELTIELTRLILPAVFLLAISTILMSTLFALQRFTLPSLSLSLRNVAIVFAALTLGRVESIGVRSLAIGIVLGALLLTLIQLPGLRDVTPVPNLHFRHPAILKIGLLYLPIFIGLFANTLALIVDRNLAWGVGEYAPAAMRYATTLNQMVLGLVAAAISLASLPALSRHWAAGDEESYWATLSAGIRMITVLVVPATFGLAVLAWPAVQLFFQHGQTGRDAAEQITIALLVYLPGTLFAAYDQALIFAYYARQNTKTPQIVGLLAVGIYFVFALTLIQPWGMAGLVAANSAQFIFHALVMLWLLRRIFPAGSQAARRFDAARVVRTIRVCTLVSIGMAVVAGALAWLLYRGLPEPTGGLGRLLCETLVLCLPAALGAALYAAGLLRLRIEEAALIKARVLAVVRRG